VLFDKGRSTITEHLKNIFETGELDEKAVCRDFRHTAEDSKGYTTRFCNLDAIIAVGFRSNLIRYQNMNGGRRIRCWFERARPRRSTFRKFRIVCRTSRRPFPFRWRIGPP
jgi:hypothetical protein